jgi:nucleotide-binding universal stress UspA family protein
MTTQSVLPVVIGVDGSEQSERAVRYAVADARRRGTGLTVVHAVSETAPMAAMLPLYSVEALAEVGRRLVEDTEREITGLDPEIDVGSSVRPGSRVGVLVEAGKHASAIVLGHRTRSLAGRVLTSSTANGVAARAHCPTVSVPDSWIEEADVGRVVVGVDDSDAAHDALGVAFGEARRRGAALRVVHAWRLPTAYDGIIVSQVDVTEWTESAGETMEKALVPWREAYPDVAVEVDFRHEHPGPALLAATEEADVIVVGRKGHGAPLGIYLGSIARMLIREARCPVIVAPQHGRHEPSAEDKLVADSEMLPQT